MKNEIKLIKTEEDYKAALKLADKLFDAEPDTPDGDKLDLLVTLIELYEKKNFPIENPSPLAAIKFRMEQLNLSQTDLIPIIGSKSKVSEVLSGKRTLSLNMIRRLSSELDIPAEVLIQPYDAIA
nr:DNA-binding protein [uncultured Treponema sp.]